ncbi:MAG: protein SCO1/2 [Planctomycetota bacterium]|jgi:protein SCO1/2
MFQSFTPARLVRIPLILLGACGFVSSAALGQVAGQEYAELEGVGIEQHLEAQLPLDATFTDAAGQPFALGQAFDGLPVILTLNYFDCPQLCDMQLANLASAMGTMGLQLGEDYRVITISIDPKDTPLRMGELRDRYVASYLESSLDAGEDRAAGEAKAGWICLTGDVLEIDRVAETVGFGYRWLEGRGEYAHQAANILCSPSGKVMRYLEGIDPALAGVLRLSLVEASEGKVGTLFDGLFLNCFKFDPTAGQYTLAATRLLKVAAALTVLAVITGVFFMKRGELQRLTGLSGTTEGKGAASASGKTS